MKRVEVQLLPPGQQGHTIRVFGDLKKDTPEYVIVETGREGTFKIPWARIHVLKETS